MTEQEAKNKYKEELWEAMKGCGVSRESAKVIWEKIHSNECDFFMIDLYNGFNTGSHIKHKKLHEAIEHFFTQVVVATKEEKPCLNIHENPFAACNHPSPKKNEAKIKLQQERFAAAETKLYNETIAAGKVWDFGASMDHS